MDTSPSESSSGGADLLSVLVSAGCPGVAGLRGEDLDWLAGDPQARQWIARLKTAFDPSCVLSEVEVDEWERRRGPALQGSELQQALQVTEGSTRLRPASFTSTHAHL